MHVSDSSSKRRGPKPPMRRHRCVQCHNRVSDQREHEVGRNIGRRGAAPRRVCDKLRERESSIPDLTRQSRASTFALYQYRQAKTTSRLPSRRNTERRARATLFTGSDKLSHPPPVGAFPGVCTAASSRPATFTLCRRCHGREGASTRRGEHLRAGRRLDLVGHASGDRSPGVDEQAHAADVARSMRNVFGSRTS